MEGGTRGDSGYPIATGYRPSAARFQSAIASLRDGFSASGRELLRRFLPFVGKGGGSELGSVVDHFRDLADALLSVRGEASGVAIATDLLALYSQADAAVRRDFFLVLANRYNPDETSLEGSWARYKAEGASALPALARAVEAPRQELFRRLNSAPGGTPALVRMRADLLAIVHEDPSLALVDADLLHLLQSWFNRGFLYMRSIDWSSPADLLERIIRYEAVHDIASWTDLRRRLDPEDRRCFAFFHPSMADEPLIFVEVGLTAEMPDDIQAMLDPERVPITAAQATTATFYSISNCQPGLRGISFGHFLIKQVAVDLKRELPNLSSFVTLSPIPGLMKWLRSTISSQTDLELLDRLSTVPEGLESDYEKGRAMLMGGAIAYFTAARTAGGKPRDPVARFHLGNGARLERLNWRADLSPNGLRQSGGLMVNYFYDLSHIEENHEAFAERGELVTGSPFRKLAKAMVSGSHLRRYSLDNE